MKVARLSPELKAKLKSNPEVIVRLIIQVKGEASSRVRDLQTRGVIVRHVFSLTPSLAVEGPASTLLTLANENWVLSVEEDKPVHTL